MKVTPVVQSLAIARFTRCFVYVGAKKEELRNRQPARRIQRESWNYPCLKTPFKSLIGAYMFSMNGINSRARRVITGPTVTTNNDGSTQKNMGNTILMASFPARSSARCRARTRR